MRYLLVGRMRNYLGGPPEERVWDFGNDWDLALTTYQVWSNWVADGLWEFHDWGWPGEVTCIKPGAFYELDLRTVSHPL